MRRLPLFLALILGSVPALAWAPETRLRIADEAVRLMPKSLRLVLERQQEQVRRGMLAPLAEEESLTHLPSWAGGSLEQQIELETRALLKELERGQGFATIARRFGRLAHFVSDAEFPPGASRADGAARYAHFSRFCATKREKFPLVFYGHEDADLARDDLRAFGARIAERAAGEDKMLARAYAAAGDPPDPAAFDDRSVPFAVGSLGYSRAVTDVVRLWLWAWREAGGDMGRTPYWKRAAGTP